MSLNRRGLTLVEMTIAIAVVGFIAVTAMNYRSSMSRSAVQSRTTAGRDRILASIRMLSGMPVALRNAVRAQNAAGGPTNPELQQCVIGNSPGACVGAVSTGFVLYSPVVAMDPTSGTVYGVTPITLPGPPPVTPATGQISGFDTFGNPCAPTGVSCPYQIFTSFEAQCGPAPLSIPPPAPVPVPALSPQPTCRVAELINVTYWIQLDPAASNLPGMAPLSVVLQGSVTTPVVAISGNVPQ